MKWIRALDLDRWADTIPSRMQLSEIVSDLIRASAAEITSFRFPTGDTAQLPGYDGRLEAIEAPPYVPGGSSVWEFGATSDYIVKANEDYSERAKNPRAVIPSGTTFVFVTPRTWSRTNPDINQWIVDKKSEGIWKDVRVVDGVALEDWLFLNPAVAARVARDFLHIVPLGIKSIAEYWAEYAARFKPPLTEEVLLAGRDAQAAELLQQLRGQQQACLWQADSTEEVVAFAVAAIRKAEPEIRKFLESRTIIVETEEAARQLAVRPGLIFIPRIGARRVDGLLAQQHATIVAIGRDSPNRPGAMALNRPTSDQLADAVKTMGLSEEQARHIARICGRSVTILARRIPSASALRPEWDGQRILIPALLAGGWDARSEQDQQAVRDLAGTASYDAYESELLPYLRVEDPPLDREGDIWKVRAPIDALAHLGPLLGRNDLDRLRTVATRVFTEIDPSLELPIEDRPFARLHGKHLKHSDWLRSGIATTLLLISEFSDVAGVKISGIIPKAFVAELIGNLPGLEQDYRVIASLHGELQLLMEASPHPLLEALERLLEGDGSRIRPIFRDTETHPFYSSSPHTELLWALEVLAWDPEYINKATLTLAKLARIDPGGKLSNRPLNSLREIFLTWHPSTNATLIQRLSALDQVLIQEPEIGWNLIVELLPEFHSTASPTAKPRYREAEASGRETITYGLMAKGYGELVSRLLRFVGEVPERWSTVITSIGSFAPVDRLRAVELLEAFSKRTDDGTRTTIWAALRDTVNRHRAFQSADWAMSEEDLSRLEAILRSLEPTDNITRISWLFDDYHPDLPTEGGLARFEAIGAARHEAIQNLVRSDGVLALVTLAEKVKLPQFVAGSAVPLIDSVSEVEAVTDAAFRTSLPKEFIITFSAGADGKFGDAWRNRVAELFREGRWSAAQVTDLLLQWNDGQKTWQFVSSLGQEIKTGYWQRKPAWYFPDDPIEMQIAARRYLEVGRALDVIDAFHHKAEVLSGELLLAILDEGLVELNKKPDRVRSNLGYELGEIFKALRRCEGVSPVEIATREYAYLPVFGYGEKTLTIHNLMAEDPALFVSILSDVFKPKSGDVREPTKENVARARAGYQLLSDFHYIPGFQGNEFDEGKLQNWIAEVRRLARTEDRARIADEYIGHLLAHAPFDEDGAWPHRKVRDLVERLASETVEEGIRVERFNMRGVTTRGPFEGGEQERALAQQMRQWAQLTRPWPRTSALLIRMAEGWERQAEQEDEEARQDKMRFE